MRKILVGAVVVVCIVVVGVAIFLIRPLIPSPVATQPQPTQPQPTTPTTPTQPTPTQPQPTQPTPTQPTPTQPQPTQPQPSIPTNFIVEDKYWANASILRRADGGHRVGVGFSSISVGAKIYAPIDGYLRVFDGKQQDGSPIEFFILTQDKEWEPWGRPDQRSWIIQARGLTPLVAGKVSKGQAFATIRENKEIFRGFYMGEVVFITAPDAEWARMPNNAITNPREYLRSAIQMLNSR